jgi:hypothetical protein
MANWPHPPHAFFNAWAASQTGIRVKERVMTQTGRVLLPFVGLLATLMLGFPGQAAAAARVKPLPHAVGAPYANGGLQRNAAPLYSPWTPLTNQPDFLVDGAANPILLTDGSVLVQDAGFPYWWKLTPDLSGSYVNGTWTQVASLPATYSPLYHSTAVLPDGRVIIMGGEYLLSLDQTQLVPSWTNQGAIYDPVANTWTMISPPVGSNGLPWPYIGDAQSVVLANGTYMQASCCRTETALLDPKTLTWKLTGSSKFDINDEEGWTLLPSGKVLAIDAYVGRYDPAGLNSELYDPVTGAWSSAGSTVVQLWDSAAACGGYNLASFEVGPAVLRPDGTVFATGANVCGPAHTAIYNSRKGTWTPGPDFPDYLGIADGPAALLPNGNVLMMASPGVFNYGARYFEWNGRRLSEVAGPPNAPYESSFFGNMLVLPTGQILLTDFYNDIEIYTPASAGETEDIAPEIEQSPSVVTRGATYRISGRGFNGVSQGAAYGDDAQAATNFPLVRITNTATGHVFYARTHNHSSMAVASRQKVFTNFDVSPATELGESKLEVVANGVASQPVAIVVR